MRGGMIKREKFLNIDNGGKGKRIYKYWVDNG